MTRQYNLPKAYFPERKFLSSIMGGEGMKILWGEKEITISIIWHAQSKMLKIKIF